MEAGSIGGDGYRLWATHLTYCYSHRSDLCNNWHVPIIFAPSPHRIDSGLFTYTFDSAQLHPRPQCTSGAAKTYILCTSISDKIRGTNRCCVTSIVLRCSTALVLSTGHLSSTETHILATFKPQVLLLSRHPHPRRTTYLWHSNI